MARKTDKKLPVPAKSDDVDAFLARLADIPVPAETTRGRLIFAMDATMSRQPSWDRALSIQADMFDTAASLGGLDVQLVWFRGFGEFYASPWAADARALAREMTGVQCRGGHTQIGRILAHALKEAKDRKPNAIVFVGDCVEEDVDELCNLAGQLGLLNVPAFIFQEGQEPSAARGFREIARLTGGAYCALGRGSAEKLKALLSAVVVYATGGKKALLAHGQKHGGDIRLLAHQVARK